MIEIFPFIITIIINIVIGVLGFFLVRYIKQIDKKLEVFYVKINDLTVGLKLTQSDVQNNAKEIVEVKTNVIHNQEKLDDVLDKVLDNKDDITILKEQVRFNKEKIDEK